ncbi:MAG: lipoprotein-releasing system transmembrane subunit LolC [Rhodospirillaceae bacterium]|nr:lipoprotein-releasing system transmembrane subunit LolC [Rhodospirillaceae bacterium]
MMFSSVELKIAIRYIRSRRTERFISVISWFSFFGITLGVATLIIVLSIQNGLRDELLNSILGFKGHISIISNSDNLYDYKSLANQVSSSKGVVNASPMIESQVLVSNENRSSGALVRGLEKTDLLNRSLISNNIISGSLKDYNNHNSVIVGSRLAAALGVFTNDNITLISPQGTITALGSIPRLKTYKIIGIFEVGHFQYDRSFIFMSLNEAQRYFRLGDIVSKIEVFVDNPDKLQVPSQSIRDILNADLTMFDWQEENHSIFSALKVQKNVMFLIVMLIVLVAAFNIISSLIMMVKDKGSAIAILRTVGAPKAMIMRIFLIAGTSVGLAGTIFGTIAGLIFTYYISSIQSFIENMSGTKLFSPEIYYFSHLPCKVVTGEVIMVILISLGLSILATLYPSWRASRLDPVVALRYD